MCLVNLVSFPLGFLLLQKISFVAHQHNINQLTGLLGEIPSIAGFPSS